MNLKKMMMTKNQKKIKFKAIWLEDFDEASKKFMEICHSQDEMVNLFEKISIGAFESKDIDLIRDLDNFRKKFIDVLSAQQKLANKLQNLADILEKNYGIKFSEN